MLRNRKFIMHMINVKKKLKKRGPLRPKTKEEIEAEEEEERKRHRYI